MRAPLMRRMNSLVRKSKTNDFRTPDAGLPDQQTVLSGKFKKNFPNLHCPLGL